jgi:type IV secretory pathway TrbF-like protein
MDTMTSPHVDNWSPEKASAEPTIATIHYLEQHGDIQTTNTFLKISLLGMVLAVFAASAATVLAVKHYSNVKPLVVRVDSVGKAEAVRYDAATYHPQEREMRYFLTQWATYYYGRNRYTVRQEFPKAFYFMDAKLSSNVIAMHQKNRTIETFLSDPSIPNTYIEVTQIVLDHLNSPPYQGTIEFTAKQMDTDSAEPLSVARYTATVQFVIRDDVPNSLVPINPLGFSIIAFHDQQAFN